MFYLVMISVTLVLSLSVRKDIDSRCSTEEIHHILWIIKQEWEDHLLNVCLIYLVIYLLPLAVRITFSLARYHIEFPRLCTILRISEVLLLLDGKYVPNLREIFEIRQPFFDFYILSKSSLSVALFRDRMQAAEHFF